ncbi:MAG: hypothetical protein ACFFB0_09040 [Promethearchaeota archaeon]
MPEVLELKPLKNKSLKLILIESEFPIDWWFEVPEELRDDVFWNLHLISKEYLQLVDSLIEKYKPDFIIEERPNSWDKKANSNDPLKTLFEMKKIPFKYADISENAELYLSATLDKHRNIIKDLEVKINELLKMPKNAAENEEFFQRILLWKEYLQMDYNTQEDEVRYKVREAWMMMNILNFAREMEMIKLKCIFICDPRHFDGLEKLSADLGINTEKVKIKRTIKSEQVEQELENELKVDF